MRNYKERAKQKAKKRKDLINGYLDLVDSAFEATGAKTVADVNAVLQACASGIKNFKD